MFRLYQNSRAVGTREIVVPVPTRWFAIGHTFVFKAATRRTSLYLYPGDRDARRPAPCE
jgi:hypothetical protein